MGFFYRQDGISVVLISNRSSYRPVLEPNISDSCINRILSLYELSFQYVI